MKKNGAFMAALEEGGESRPVGIVADQLRVKSGVRFLHSADKAARFMALRRLWNFSALFLKVRRFMLGSTVEKQGILRYSAHPRGGRCRRRWTLRHGQPRLLP